MQSATGTLTLAEVFAGDSENERTFHGFSDNEISGLDKDPNCGGEDDAQLELSPKELKVPFKPSTGTHSFKLRVVLRATSFTQPSTDDDDEDTEEEQRRKTKKRFMKAENNSRAKMRRVKFEDENEERAVSQPSPDECGSDSVDDSFLAKREQNIKANKAMLAQLMADLQKMPGGAGFLKKQAGKQNTKERSSRSPRSGASGGEFRKNPERVSRRQTRSMTGSKGPQATKEEDVELSLEEELLEVRRAPQRRGTPRPNQTKPHFIRPVEDITEDEVQLVADNMTDKVYNRVTGSTCHQCRQKTIDTKTCCRGQDCRGIQGQFCGPCLRNRYGEDVRKALLDPEWKCPPCRGICNCSFCRQREGRCPTGILFPLAQYHGFSDVHSYLSSLRDKLRNETD